MQSDLEASIAARLCCAGMPKLLIIAAFRRSRQNGTSFIEELYAVDGADSLLITRCLADEAGLMFEDVPDDVQIINPTGPDFAKLRGIRIARALVATYTVQIYIAPTLADIAQIKRDFAASQTVAQRLRIIAPSRLAQLFLASHHEYLAESAVRMVEKSGARHTARIVASGRQGAIMGTVAASSLFLIALAPGLLWSLLHIVFSIVFMGCITLRLLASRHARIGRRPVHLLQDGRGTPLYSVMIALYKEADVVPQLVEAMKKLNWPRSRLEVLFLCETDDLATVAACKQQSLPMNFKVICVPGSGPRTKPKALNYGLQLIEGDFVVIYDAEDRPHPDQLREAWQKFKSNTPDLGCLQAPLVIANAHEGWMERQFAFEYAAQFRGLLPWLADGRFVMPLGGSSNHFRSNCLVEVGGWDPFNVTEDAELGSRLARHGYHVGMLSMPTIEDAPTEVNVWLKQRTRWLKGWVQTWLVEMRQPATLLKQIGLKRFMVYHLLMGGMVVSALLYPFMLIFIAQTIIQIIATEASAANVTLIFDVMSIVLGFMSFLLLGRIALKKERMPGRILPWTPVYWLMISAAAWRALWQLQAAPFLWEKTPHRPSSTDKIQRKSGPEPIINESSFPTTLKSRSL